MTTSTIDLKWRIAHRSAWRTNHHRPHKTDLMMAFTRVSWFVKSSETRITVSPSQLFKANHFLFNRVTVLWIRRNQQYRGPGRRHPRSWCPPHYRRQKSRMQDCCPEGSTSRETEAGKKKAKKDIEKRESNSYLQKWELGRSTADASKPIGPLKP